MSWEQSCLLLVTIKGSSKYQKPIRVYSPYLNHGFGSHTCSQAVGGSSRVPSCWIRRIMRNSGAMFQAGDFNRVMEPCFGSNLQQIVQSALDGVSRSICLLPMCVVCFREVVRCLHPTKTTNISLVSNPCPVTYHFLTSCDTFSGYCNFSCLFTLL